MMYRDFSNHVLHTQIESMAHAFVYQQRDTLGVQDSNEK